jgi:hypothetical protein
LNDFARVAIESTTDVSARRVDAEVDSVEGTVTRASERTSERASERRNEGRIRGARLDGSDADRSDRIEIESTDARVERARESAVRR